MTDTLQDRIKELLKGRAATAVDGRDHDQRVTLPTGIEVVVEVHSNFSAYAKFSISNDSYGVRFGDGLLAYGVENTIHGSAYTDSSWTDDAFYEEDLTPKQTGNDLSFNGVAIAMWTGTERAEIEAPRDPGFLRGLAEAVGLATEEPSSTEMATGWAHGLLQALGLPQDRRHWIALCDEVLFPVLDTTPPPETSDRLASVFLMGNQRSARLSEELWAWYQRESSRAGAAADQIEAGRDSDAALDSGGAAFAQIEGPASTHRDALTAKIQEAERLMADGDSAGASTLLDSVEATLTRLRHESS